MGVSVWDGPGKPGVRVRNVTAAVSVAHVAAGRVEVAVDRVNGLAQYNPDPMMILDFCHEVAHVAHVEIARALGRELHEAVWMPDPRHVALVRAANMRFGIEFIAAHTRGDERMAAELFRGELDMHEMASAFHGAPAPDGIMASVMGVVSTAGGVVRGMRS